MNAVTIVGARGHVGCVLDRSARKLGLSVVTVDRGERVPTQGRGPVLLACRASALEKVLHEQTPRSRWDDLVFLQNGAVFPKLEAWGLGESTQGLLYGAFEKGGVAVDGGGMTVLYGEPWAEETALLLAEAGISASLVSRSVYTGKSLEKLLWSSIFWCMSAAEGGLPIGDFLVAPYTKEIEQLVGELLSVSYENFGLKQQPDPLLVTQNLLVYTSSISHAIPSVSMALKEFDWRNAYFLRGNATPLYWKLLRRAADNVDGLHDLLDKYA